MAQTRRELLEAMATATALSAVGLTADEALARARPLTPARAGTTLENTILRGPQLNAQGYRRLVAGAGEPFVVRQDLGVLAQRGRASRRRGLLSLVQFTDTHV